MKALVPSNDGAGKLAPAVDADRAHLRNALTEFERAWTAAVHHGAGLLDALDEMDKQRERLQKHGWSLGTDFAEIGLPEVQAALRRHRELIRDPLEVPEFLR